MPQLKIVSPANNQTILGDKITVSFIVGDLEVGREGHLDLWLDADPKLATPSAHLETHYDYVLSQLPQGRHNLTLEVVKPDHQPFIPKVLQTVNFQTRLSSTPAPSAIQKPFLTDFLFDKTFIGLGLGMIIIFAGIFIGRMTKGRLD